MLRFIARMLAFAGPYAGRLKRAFVLSFLDGLLANVPIFTALYVFTGMAGQSLTEADVWLCGAVMAGALIIRILVRRMFLVLQSSTAYEVCERERIAIGDRFKRFPMSHFTEGNLGNISSVLSNDLLFIEENGMNAMDKVINGHLSLLIGCIVMFIIDWRIGLTVLALSLLTMLALNNLQKVGRTQSRIRQSQQAKLTAAVLEYVQGIAVIKAFHMSDDKARTVKNAIQDTRDFAIQFEKTFTPPAIRFQVCVALTIAATVLLSALLYLDGSLSLAIMLTLIVYVFYMFLPVQALASLTGMIRVMEAGLDRYEKLQHIEILDADSTNIQLDRYDITFDRVTFAYGEQPTLSDLSFHVPENSRTALVGASGSGKTTIANLIMRFWDVQQGEIRIGGVNVKEMTNESLLRHISMVFQKVYLFNDTVYNNIRFGKPGATDEEIIEAARKARCHEFIMSLEHGYETMVGEGGDTLSGGEKQRISIARAILKDAPIILLDEATANVDPDNELQIQSAIDELVKHKTVLVIAHRLSTIKEADQILVMDKGQLAQYGKHEELIRQDSPYRELWKRRENARSWKIAAEPEA